MLSVHSTVDNVSSGVSAYEIVLIIVLIVMLHRDSQMGINSTQNKPQGSKGKKRKEKEINN